jgi:hypothetical protein
MEGQMGPVVTRHLHKAALRIDCVSVGEIAPNGRFDGKLLTSTTAS